MMTEISLNVLDVAENCIRADASLVEITCTVDTASDRLTVIIKDNGCGMSREKLAAVTDPFFTTRTTRRVGLGVSFFKLSAELTGGSFGIESQEGVGTTVTAVYVISSIDRMPLGDMPSTIHSLVTLNMSVDFVYTYSVDGSSFTLDTREFREILGDVPFDSFEVSAYIKEYLEENTAAVSSGQTF